MCFNHFHFYKVLAMGASQRVRHCPRDEKEWQKASNRLNCSDDVTDVVNRYHCLPTDSLTTLLEFCYNRTRANVINGKLYSHNHCIQMSTCRPDCFFKILFPRFWVLKTFFFTLRTPELVDLAHQFCARFCLYSSKFREKNQIIINSMKHGMCNIHNNDYYSSYFV